jgi:hypothetical protein
VTQSKNGGHVEALFHVGIFRLKFIWSLEEIAFKNFLLAGYVKKHLNRFLGILATMPQKE